MWDSQNISVTLKLRTKRGQVRRTTAYANFQIGHAVIGKTQVLPFWPVLRELSMFCCVILKIRLFHGRTD